MFPIQSTSFETVRIAHAIEVFQRRPKVSALVTAGGVYNCKQDDPGPPILWSAHAFGDAVDLMCSQGSAALQAIADRCVLDATTKTKANRGKLTHVLFVIYEQRQWIKGHGWSAYGGIPHTNHVHVACSFSTHQKPRCAGGTNLDTPYLHG